MWTNIGSCVVHVSRQCARGQDSPLAPERDNRIAELEQELVGEDAALAGLKEGATLEQLQETLDRLRHLRGRVEQRQLESDDWAPGPSLAPWCGRR